MACFIDNPEQYFVALAGIAFQADYRLVGEIETLFIYSCTDNIIPLLLIFLPYLFANDDTMGMNLVAAG